MSNQTRLTAIRSGVENGKRMLTGTVRDDMLYLLEQLAQVTAERDKMKAGQLLAAAPIISANETLRVKLAEADATCLALQRKLREAQESIEDDCAG